jgi:hypothetical protein
LDATGRGAIGYDRAIGCDGAGVTRHGAIGATGGAQLGAWRRATGRGATVGHVNVFFSGQSVGPRSANAELFQPTNPTNRIADATDKPQPIT